MHCFSNRLLAENIDSVAQYDISNRKVFGSAYFVYHNGETIERCYGTHAPDSDVPVTSDTAFRLASMTKPITTVAAMILVERGLFSLEDPIDLFLPEFQNMKIIDASGNVSAPQKKPTVKSILTHSSGIGSDPEKMKNITAQDQRTLQSAVSYYAKAGLDFEPDSMQKYSGIGAFDVLTRIIEVVSETDFLQFLNKEIFDPCGMRDTTFIPSREQRMRMIEMHNRVNGENVVFPMPDHCVFGDVPCTHYLGGAGLLSTLRDYCKFAKMLLRCGQAENGRVLSEASVRLLSTPHFYKVENQSWGLGMRVITKNTYPYLPAGSFGWSGAYGSHFWIDPTNNLFAVFMKNSRVDGGAANESARNFEKAVYSSLIGE